MVAEVDPPVVDVLALSASELLSRRLSASLRARLSDGRPERGRVVVIEALEETSAAVEERLTTLAALHPGVTLRLRRGAEEREFAQPTGLSGLLRARLVGQSVRLPAVARFSASLASEAGEIQGEVALQWVVDGEGFAASFVNDEATPGHGTPLQGVAAGLSRALEEEGLERNLLHYGMPALTRRRVLSGVAMLLRLEHPAPRYSTPSQLALANQEAAALFEQLVHRKVRALCQEQGGLIEALLTRALGVPLGRPVERRASSPELQLS